MTAEQRRERWQEARVASDAYRRIAAATSGSWWAVANAARNDVDEAPTGIRYFFRHGAPR
jgi:hypothetical protein